MNKQSSIDSEEQFLDFYNSLTDLVIGSKRMPPAQLVKDAKRGYTILLYARIKSTDDDFLISYKNQFEDNLRTYTSKIVSSQILS